jgi:drug/metabolite transporter (DMT)-like permease
MSETPGPRSKSLRADAVLVAVTAVWGSSFVVVKNVLEVSPPFEFLFWRFLLATLLAGLLALGRRAGPGLLRDGLATGLILAAGMAFQVLGQTETTASKAAFLTGLSVVLTPFAAYARTRRLPSLENGIGIALASAGFFVLTFPRPGETFERGDLLMTACGVVFAFYIVELAERSPRHDPVLFTGVQLATVALASLALLLALRLPLLAGLHAAAVESRPAVWGGTLLFSILYLGSIGAVGTFLGQTWAQRQMSATHAAIIFTLEPVFAALHAAWFLGERLGPRGAAGAVLILAGIVVSEVRFRTRGPTLPLSS